jgi:hypothetical protein
MPQPGQAKNSSVKLTKGAFADFSGGWVVYTGALALAGNQSPDMLNVVPFPGRLTYRGGTSKYSTLPYVADATYQFYDTNEANHFAVWAGGNLYDCISGTPVLIAASVYSPSTIPTEGLRIGRVDLNGILYWSNQTVALQFWNPVTATHGAVPQTGSSLVPSSPYLTIYTNSIVACGVNFTPATPSAFQPNVFSWSAFDAPGNWTAANSQAVGPNNSGHLEFGMPFGIAEIGVNPFRTLIMGRADQGLYAYTGALGSLTEALINCPVGCLDEASVQFLPSAEAFGTIIFLGTDGQFWATNGVTAYPISLPVLPILSAAIESALATNPSQRFNSSYNEKSQYYWCDVAGTQYVYKWDLKCWSKFQGWPTGPTFVVNSGGVVNFGVPTMYVASNNTANLGLFKIAQDGLTDNGSPPNVYYQSPYLHFGNLESFKEFEWAAIHTYNTGTNYSVNGQSNLDADGNFTQSTTLLLNQPGTGGVNYFILDHSLLDGTDVLAPATVFSVGTGTPLIMHGRLSVPVTPTSPYLQGIKGLTERLRGVACSFTISYAGGTMDYELIGLEVRYKDNDEYKRSGGKKFSAQNGISTVSPYMPNISY